MKTLYMLFFLLCAAIAVAEEQISKEFYEATLIKAEGGDVKAQVDLGVIYENGLYGNKNLSQAYKWYLEAAKQNNARAKFYIHALWLKKTPGITTEIAMEYLTQAAQQGHYPSITTALTYQMALPFDFLKQICKAWPNAEVTKCYRWDGHENICEEFPFTLRFINFIVEQKNGDKYMISILTYNHTDVVVCIMKPDVTFRYDDNDMGKTGGFITLKNLEEKLLPFSVNDANFMLSQIYDFSPTGGTVATSEDGNKVVYWHCNNAFAMLIGNNKKIVIFKDVNFIEKIYGIIKNNKDDKLKADLTTLVTCIAWIFPGKMDFILKDGKKTSLTNPSSNPVPPTPPPSSHNSTLTWTPPATPASAYTPPAPSPVYYTPPATQTPSVITGTTYQVPSTTYHIPSTPPITSYQPSYPTSDVVKPNAYGPGVGMDQYGSAVRYAPAFGGAPINSGEQLNVRSNAYGPGVGMDQYGRAVRTVPAY